MNEKIISERKESKMNEIMQLSDKLGEKIFLLEEMSRKININLNGSNDQIESKSNLNEVNSTGSLDEIKHRLSIIINISSDIEYNLNNIIKSID